MSFLEPFFLLALPLMALPIVIHLLNQRRHRTAPWAARHFILQASRQGRGIANMRHWLVLAFRTLVIAALIIAISRPLASRVGGLDFFAARRAQIIIVDRSPSMAIRDSVTGQTWRESSLDQLQQHLRTVGGKRYLVHALSPEPVALPQRDLRGLAETEIIDAPTNLPALIDQTLRYIEDQAMGPTDVWVCTDRRSSDWQTESGQWPRIARTLEASKSTKLHFLVPEPHDEFNLAISVDNVSLTRESDQYYVTLDFLIQQTSGSIQQRTVPIHVQLADGERHLEIEMVSEDYRQQELKIPVPSDRLTGGGVIRLAQDSNPRDNQFYFSYAKSPDRQTVIVSDDDETAELLELVCSTPFESQATLNCQVLPTSGKSQVDWANTSLILWHAPIPDGALARRMQQFVQRGGNVIFLPNERSVEKQELFGIRWGDWEFCSATDSDSQTVSQGNDRRTLVSQIQERTEAFRVAQWRTEDDILATDPSGRELPLKSIACLGRREIQSDSAITLASFADGRPMLVRAPTDNGGVYFLATLPSEELSTFIDDGVALYVMVHRALEQGAGSLALHQQLDAGDPSLIDIKNPVQVWDRLEDQETKVPEDRRAFHAGIYQRGGKLIAVNRPISEDSLGKVDEADVTSLLGEGACQWISTMGQANRGLTSEIWKWFIIAMILAMIAEAWFTLPAAGKSSSAQQGGIA